VTTQKKIILGIAAIIGVALVVRHLRNRNGAVLIRELNMVDCNCFETTFFADGTTRSTKVSLDRCIADELLREKATQCQGGT
jgi:hypothetical protein